MDNIPSEMLRGHIDTIILLSLIDSDKHTAQIKEEIEERAGGGFELKQGTFYSCLQRIVKQGYVTEYRTSNTPDGVRRKFYQLTEKGKVYIDENKDKWTYSRALINTLIEVPEAPATKKTPSTARRNDEVVTQPSTEDELSPEEALNKFLYSHSQEEEQTTSSQNSRVENGAEIAKNAEKREESETAVVDAEEPKHTEKHASRDKTPDNYDFFTLIDYTQSDIITRDENYEKKDESIPAFISDAEDYPIYDNAEKRESASVSDKKESETSVISTQEKSTETVNKSSDNKTIITASVIKASDIKPNETERNDIREEQKQAAKSVVLPPENPGDKDDRFDPESMPATDYKNVLSRIFYTAPEQKEEKTVVVDYKEGFDINTFFNKNEPIDERKTEKQKQTKQQPKKAHVTKEQTVERREKQRRETAVETPRSQERITTVHHNYYDFSDVKSMADSEGFKVKISSSEVKRDTDRILINKLLFHSALIFFLIIAVETFVLYFTTAQAANLTIFPYLVFLLVAALHPLVTGITYSIKKDKKIPSVPTFKSAVELVAIIMLNLILIMIVCCVLSNLDFSDQQSVIRYIVYPTMLILDMPIYLFIKYLKLDKDNYFI